MATISPPRDLSSESSFGGAADTFDHVASLSSTPPTTHADSVSLASEASKHDNVILSDAIDPVQHEESHEDQAAVTEPQPMEVDSLVVATEPVQPIQEPQTSVATTTPADTPSSGRSRRARKSEPVYNLSKLSGTDIHGKRRSKGDVVSDKRDRRRTMGDAMNNVTSSGGNDGIDSPDLPSSMRRPNSPKSKGKKRAPSPEPPSRIYTRSSGIEVGNLARKVASLGKRSRKTFEQDLGKMSRELKKLQDTNEYAGIDTKPVIYTTWAKGKYVDPAEAAQPAQKKTKVSESEDATFAEKTATPVPDAPVIQKRTVKKWLDRGLYSGQDASMDITKNLTPSERKSLAELPELAPSAKTNEVLPSPIFNGLRLLIKGRDFKLPFDVCNPLPPGQPKPDAWRQMTRNRFVGDAGAYWKKTPHFKDYQSKCVCTPEDGCTESCQNRIMLYECDETNCNAGAAYCHNRAFARLQERTKAGGKYRVGVEVIKTKDRGYGIRSNRCFEPNQIIMEYTGEIITEDECDRRMKEKYKDNECYYLMSFDQNMIIDATTGSIARFVNHSCNPNCRMIKWIVSGQPRMALFAGDRPIMTGEELTYDYNFDPFSSKNVQKCLCGSANCRGVLGPKHKEVKLPKAPKPTKEELKKTVKKSVSAGKRKLKELLGDKEDEGGNDAKKRKIKTPTGVKGTGLKRTISLSSASVKAVKGAIQIARRSVSTISVNKTATPGTKAPSSASKLTSVKRKSSVVKTYSKTSTTSRLSTTPRKTPSRNASLTIVAAATAGDENAKSGKQTPTSVKSTIAAKGVISSDKGKKTTGSPRCRPRRNAATPVSRNGIELARDASTIRLVNSPSS